MDKNVAHDLVHQWNGGLSENCPACNGSMDAGEVMAEAKKIAIKNAKPKVNPDLPYSQRLMTYEELDSKARNNLEDSSFAYIDSKGGRHLPIHDISHVRAALSRFNQTKFESDDAKKKAKARIDAAAKKFGVDAEDNNDDNDNDAEDKKELKNSEPTLRSFIDVFSFSENKTSLPTKIKVLNLGEVDSPRYGKVKITKDVINAMIKNFDESVRAHSKDIGLPIRVEHGQTKLMDAAAGWMKKLFAEKDGLYANVEWTPIGKQALENKIYKCVSPGFWLEGYKDPETSKEIQNVMTEVSLVNFPGMPHSLPPIVNSETPQNTLLTEELKTSTIFIEIKNLPNTNMNLKEILQKEQAKRTSEEQKFLVENKGKLSFDEAKAEGFAMDFKEEETGKKEEVKPGQIVMSEQDVKTMQEDIKTFKEKAEQSFKELAEMKKKTDLIEMTEKVKQAAITDKGIKLPADQIDKFAGKLVNMSEDDRKDMLEMITALPTKEIFEEKGAENAVNMSENPGLALDTLTKAKVAEAQKAGKEMKYTEAQAIVFKENPNLMKSAYAPQTN